MTTNLKNNWLLDTDARADEAIRSSQPRGTERTGRVLCLGNDDRVLLAVARSLGRRGLEVHTGWCDARLPANRSRYVHRHHELPEFRPDDPSWTGDLNGLVDRFRFDLVIPINDFAVLPLQLNRERLSSTTRWYLLDDATHQIVSDKRRTADLAVACGVPVPREYRIQPGDGAPGESNPEWFGDLEFPVYVKSPSSIVARDVANKQAVVRVDDPQELARLIQQPDRESELLVQQGFAGVGQGVEVLAWQGQVLVEMQHRRIRETIDGGSTCREVVRSDPALSTAARRLIQALNYTGVAMVEFRVDPDSGEFVLLEINGRFWGSLPLAVAAGVDFPWYLYRLLVSGQVQFPKVRPCLIQCRNLLPDLRQLRRQSGAVSAVASLITGPLSGVREDHFATDDVAPYVALWCDIARAGLEKMSRRSMRATGPLQRRRP